MAQMRNQPEPLPRGVMIGVSWSFGAPTFGTREAFEESVRAYQVQIRGEDTWNPDEVVIPRPQVKVMYRTWIRGKEAEPVVELLADNGASFTAGELLFKVHRAVADNLRKRDHKFFWGFRLSGDPGINEVPLYYMRLGS
jgi:hypothetical protein